MMPIDNPQHEAFAQARARGLTQRASGVEAGYSPCSGKTASRLANSKAIINRVKAIRAAAEATSVETMIRTLVAYAKTASEKESAAGMVAARGLIAEAAKLRMATGKKAPAASAAEAPPDDDWAPRPYTEADWDRICQPD
jgi:hypothetical protein